MEKEEWKTNPMGPDFRNAGAHNSLYRGKFLGDAVTDAQYAAIAAGTFDGLYIGDYWTINNINWRIAAFDYFLNTGDIATTKHHVVIVPNSILYTHGMNDTNTIEGGYVGSKMYTSGLTQAKNTIKATFSGHVLQHRISLINSIKNGRPLTNMWCNSEVDLMNEMMVYGGPVFASLPDGVNISSNFWVEKTQLPLFRYRPDLISIRRHFWLRDVVTASTFSVVSENGNASNNNASFLFGVRPYFCIAGN